MDPTPAPPRRWVTMQDLVWVALFTALALLSPHPGAAEIEMLAVLAVLELAAPRVGALQRPAAGMALLVLKLLAGFLLIGVTGGILSNYYLILLLPVLSAATTLGSWGAAGLTALACAAYLAFLPLATQFGYRLAPEVLHDVLLRVIFLPVVGYFTYQLAAANRAEARRAQAAAADLASANRNLQAAEDAVRRGERLAALGQLTAGLAHELRNPMGTIRASAEMLTKNLGADNPLAAELAGYIATEVDRANALVTRFLEFARPLKLRRAPADLNDLVDRALLLVERGQPAPHCALHRNYAPEVPAVPADAELLERVVVNLVRNAVDASPAGSDVTVRTRLLDGHAEIAVLDRGSGIAPADREQIFNPFFTTKPEGVGLGLAIVHKIVAEHGGSIAVESEPGKGSVFQVLLPLVGGAPR